MVGSKEAVETLRGRCAAAIGSRAEYTRRRESCNAPRAAPNIELDTKWAVSDVVLVLVALVSPTVAFAAWERKLPKGNGCYTLLQYLRGFLDLIPSPFFHHVRPQFYRVCAAYVLQYA